MRLLWMGMVLYFKRKSIKSCDANFPKPLPDSGGFLFE